jgi:hypothetical protein
MWKSVNYVGVDGPTVRRSRIVGPSTPILIVMCEINHSNKWIEAIYIYICKDAPNKNSHVFWSMQESTKRSSVYGSIM